MSSFLKPIFGLILTILSINTFSQLDTEHYIPPLFGREDQGTHYIVLSTHSTIPFDVTITVNSAQRAPSIPH